MALCYSINKELVDSFYRSTGKESLIENAFVSIDLLRRSQTIGRGAGRNAFGVTVRYTIKTHTAMRLAIMGTALDPLFGPKITIKAAPAQARLLFGHLAVAFTGRLSFPFVSQQVRVERATVTDPEEAQFFDSYLFFEPSSIRVFDRNTGRILGALELRAREKEMKQ